MDYSKLPAVNAALNSASAVFLILGYALIRQRAITGHAMAMSAATITSVLFLVSYITYHLHHHVTHYEGQGWLRPVYFFILITHTVLAVVNVPFVAKTLFRALSGKFPQHVAIARITLPIWLYVSVTGVIVYWMLYH